MRRERDSKRRADLHSWPTSYSLNSAVTGMVSAPVPGIILVAEDAMSTVIASVSNHISGLPCRPTVAVLSITYRPMTLCERARHALLLHKPTHASPTTRSTQVGRLLTRTASQTPAAIVTDQPHLATNCASRAERAAAAAVRPPLPRSPCPEARHRIPRSRTPRGCSAWDRPAWTLLRPSTGANNTILATCVARTCNALVGAVPRGFVRVELRVCECEQCTTACPVLVGGLDC